MNIKDIVNRDTVTLTNCEQEPIHIPGSIQPHGFLLAMHTDTMVIDFCSANAVDFLGLTYSQCLGRSFADIFGDHSRDLFLVYVQNVMQTVNPPLVLGINGRDLLCTANLHDGRYIAEFEPAPGTPDITSVYDQTIRFVSYMESSDTLQDLCSKVADQTRSITGYDRVMIYRFDKNYNGEVFAESKVNTIEPFLGLHYPHTDIPAQARQLYLTNLMRMIVDVNDKPLPIYTIDDKPGKNLDLSKSHLRSVSPIHIEYLQNMGVGGTLTISLIHNSRLWGLITCHHYSAKYVPLYSRIAAQMQGYFLTSQISVRQLNEEYKAGAAINASLEKLLDKTYESTPRSFHTIISDPLLLSLCKARGAAILFEGEAYLAGDTPGSDDIMQLAAWLHGFVKHDRFHTHRLADIYPAAKTFADTGAGIIYHSLSGLQNDAIIWFAPETKEVVNWGGDPNTAIVKTEKGLSPRNSFELWKQVLQYESREWSTPALLAAATFAHSLQKHITLIFISEEEKKQRILTQQLSEANTELENINWISSHDLKEPLRKIQLFSSMMLEDEQASPARILQLQKKINASAGRMQELISDITTYNRVRHLKITLEPIDLCKLTEQIAEEQNDEFTEKDASFSCTQLPVVNGNLFLLKQLFSNLIGNSIKFAQKDIPLRITVSADAQPIILQGSDDQLFVKVSIADNGIGFDNAHNEDIFKIFKRLHRVAEYEGLGIGLALCKKIMQNHKGYIEAEGAPGAGATFHLYFPVAAQTGQ